ncbi:MAG: redoxin domain-containing protein [Prevotella sp.]|nr:redoxin domain-containing protein [Prevotella sp.]
MCIRSKYLAGALAAIVLSIALSGCGEDKFEISGEVDDAGGQTLYFDRVEIDGVTTLDSVSLGADGRFAFRRAGVSSPEYYRLRLDGQVINLAVDSTESIRIAASRAAFATDYKVSGSDDCAKIRELSLLQIRLQRRVNAIINDPTLRVSETEDSLASVIQSYKTYVKKNYIYSAPYRSYAYFALFQTVVAGGMERLIFNPRADEEDIKAFAAVGTSWDTYYPGTVRGENLHNITIESMKNIKILRAEREAMISPDRIDTSGVVDIALADNKGNVRRLSDLKGNVILLDFCSLAQEGTAKRMMALRDIYNKYHARGFEIYQVSIDQSEHFWKTQTAALPWVSVNDPAGLGADCLVTYNVSRLPTYFLLQRDCTPYKRDEQITDLDKEIEALL